MILMKFCHNATHFLRHILKSKLFPKFTSLHAHDSLQKSFRIYWSKFISIRTALPKVPDMK